MSTKGFQKLMVVLMAINCDVASVAARFWPFTVAVGLASVVLVVVATERIGPG